MISEVKVKLAMPNDKKAEKDTRKKNFIVNEVLLYGSETRRTSKTLTNKLQTFIN
uniref:Uncharacterized protein n=1 Tax=Arion vulgaris TaxID=1028688 RepID=A0A0B7B4W1_9EUPU